MNPNEMKMHELIDELMKDENQSLQLRDEKVRSILIAISKKHAEVIRILKEEPILI